MKAIVPIMPHDMPPYHDANASCIYVHGHGTSSEARTSRHEASTAREYDTSCNLEAHKNQENDIKIGIQIRH